MTDAWLRLVDKGSTNQSSCQRLTPGRNTVLSLPVADFLAGDTKNFRYLLCILASSLGTCDKSQNMTKFLPAFEKYLKNASETGLG